MIRSVDGVQKCMNIYDVRLEDDYPACGMNWPPDLDDVTPYLAVRPKHSAVLLNCVWMLTFVAFGCRQRSARQWQIRELGRMPTPRWVGDAREALTILDHASPGRHRTDPCLTIRG